MDEYVESNRETIKVNKEEYEQLLKDVANLKEQNEKDNNSWKLYKTVTGATEIDISNLDFQELRLVCTAHRGSTFNDNWVLTQDILESDLSTERTDIYCAGFGNGSTVNQFLVKCSKGKVKLTYMIISGKDYISSAVTKVYYK